MRILFLQPLMFTPGYQTVSGDLRPMPNLGLLYIASIAKGFGEVEFEYVSTYNVVKVIEQHSPDIVCLSVVTTQYPTVKELCRIIKRVNEEITIILGGYYPTFMFHSVLDEIPVDYIVVGEGEETFNKLMEYLENNRGNLEDIEGLAFKKDGRKIFTGHRRLVDDLDKIPFPAWDIVNKKPKTIDFITSRGCPFPCEFCSISAFYGRRFRVRSVENVIKEVEVLVKQGYKRFNMPDDNLLADSGTLKEICEALGKFDVKFACQGRIDAIYRKPEILQVLHDAGCDTIALGLDSGIQEGLDALNKKITLEQAKFVAEELENFGDITTVWFLMVGTADGSDTRSRIHESIDFAFSLPHDIIQLSILTPYPGTPLFNRLEAENRILTYDWNKYDCCHCVYQPLGMAPEELERIWSETYYKVFMNKDILNPKKLKKLNVLRNTMSLSLSGITYFVSQFIRYLANNRSVYALFERDQKLFEKRIQEEISSSY